MSIEYSNDYVAIINSITKKKNNKKRKTEQRNRKQMKDRGERENLEKQN